MKISRSSFLALALAGLSLAACQKAPTAVAADEMTMGDPNAKVTVVEYASVACPFCARVNNTVFPAFKAQYVDTGKVHYVFREMLVGNGQEQAFGAAGFLLARCVGKDKYFSVVDAIFHGQDAMYQSGDIRGGLLKIAQSTGMNEKQFNDCVTNQDSLKAMNARSDKAVADGVNETPTFVINGKKLGEGEVTLDRLSAAIKAAGA